MKTLRRWNWSIRQEHQIVVSPAIIVIIVTSLARVHLAWLTIEVHGWWGSQEKDDSESNTNVWPSFELYQQKLRNFIDLFLIFSTWKEYETRFTTFFNCYLDFIEWFFGRWVWSIIFFHESDLMLSSQSHKSFAKRRMLWERMLATIKLQKFSNLRVGQGYFVCSKSFSTFSWMKS